MPFHITRVFPVLTAVLALGLLSSTAHSQSAGGRTALAAKQHLKNEVLNAMADGKISNLERAEILVEAREVLTVKEYEGLKATMDRLSPPEKPTAEIIHSANERAIAASLQDQSDSPMFLSRMLSHVPYVEDFSLGPHPQVRKIASSIPYAKSREIDVSGAKQALAKVPRLSETYLEPPTADRPLPKVAHVAKTSASSRITAKSSPSRKNQALEKRPRSKYADESISPLPTEANAAEPNMVRQPNKVMEEMSPLAREPSVEEDSSDLVTPVGAILPDRSTP